MLNNIEFEVPYKMKPGMKPIKEGLAITFQDNDFDDVIIQKREVLSDKRFDPILYGNSWDFFTRSYALEYLNCNSIEEATLKYQEDFCIWAKDFKDDYSLQCTSLCFPSSWDPTNKINKTFEEIHKPVADNQLIMSSAKAIGEMIASKGPFRRYVWTISNSGNLNQHPKVKKPWSNETMDGMFLRVEEQTTVPFKELCLFFIKVKTQPLYERSDLNKILDSINSMSEEIVTYKGLTYVRDFFNRN